MIQFNLLPDVKIQYIKTRHIKRLISVIALMLSSTAILIVFILFVFVQVSQKGHISRLSDDISGQLTKLQSTEDLDKILTIQNQLKQLPALHEGKPESSRLFDYLTQLTPENATISSVTLNLVNAQISISGRADSLATVNQYADTLKFSTYRFLDADGNPVGEGVKPFSAVSTRLSRDNSGANYTIDFTYDLAIFNNTTQVALNVPKIVSTRSSVNKPGAEIPESDDVFDDTPEPADTPQPLIDNVEGGTQ